MLHENDQIFTHAPTPDQIREVVKKSGMTQAKFERQHGIYRTGINEALRGKRKMPTQHWHLFLKPKNASGKKPGNGSTGNGHNSSQEPAIIAPLNLPPETPSKLSSLIDSLGL